MCLLTAGGQIHVPTSSPQVQPASQLQQHNEELSSSKQAIGSHVPLSGTVSPLGQPQAVGLPYPDGSDPHHKSSAPLEANAVTDTGQVGPQQKQLSHPAVSSTTSAKTGLKSVKIPGSGSAEGDCDAGRPSGDKTELTADRQRVSKAQIKPSPSMSNCVITAKPIGKGVLHTSAHTATEASGLSEPDKCTDSLLMVRRLPAVLTGTLPTMESLGVLTDLPTGAGILSTLLLLLCLRSCLHLRA